MEDKGFTGNQVPVDLVERAVEVYQLNKQFGTDDAPALASALTSALEAHARQLTDELAELALAFAEDIDSSEDDENSIAGDGAAALMWFARQLKENIPQNGDYDYVPQEHDTIEVVMKGTVVTSAAGKSSLAFQPASGTLLLNFNRALLDGMRVRVLYRS